MGTVRAGSGTGGSGRRSRIEVRRLQGGRALRVDGTLASWYRPGQVLTGSVWDALAAPLAWLPPARRRSVLVLGLGGGSAARVARALAPRARIVGVELDPAVVRAAREGFDLDELDVQIVIDDARRFLDRDKRRFDAVLDDIFVGRGRSAHKPDWLPEPGLALAARRVAAGGLLVSNALDEAPVVARAMAGLFPAAVDIAVKGYDNRILVGGPRSLCARSLRAAVAQSSVLAPTLERLAFRTLRALSRGGSGARRR